MSSKIDFANIITILLVYFTNESTLRTICVHSNLGAVLIMLNCMVDFCKNHLVSNNAEFCYADENSACRSISRLQHHAPNYGGKEGKKQTEYISRTT